MYFDGWEALYNGAKAFLANSNGRRDADALHKVSRTEWTYRVNGNMAWVKYVQVTEGTPPRRSQQFRVLERGKDGNWRISMLAAVQ
jgi:hypothetical protein